MTFRGNNPTSFDETPFDNAIFDCAEFDQNPARTVRPIHHYRKRLLKR